MLMKTLIVIPAYNAGDKIKPVLDFLREEKEHVIVVDDGSTDDTKQVIIEQGFFLIEHQTNMGLSHAIRSGLEYARAWGFESIVTIDADGQHDPRYINDFVLKLSSCDYVLGNRFYDTSYIPSCKIASNLFASLIVYSITGRKIPDVSCGYRGFNLRSFSFCGDVSGFEVVYDQLYRAISRGLIYSVVNVPVVYPCDEMHCTRVSEMISLLNVSMRYCFSRMLLMKLERVLCDVTKRVNFFVAIEGFSFFFFYVSCVDAYVLQTDLDKARSFYE